MEEKTHDENEGHFDKEKDEDYGLPNVSYEPVNREDAREPIIMNPKEQQSKKNNNDSSWPLIIGIIVIVALAGVFVYLFLIKDADPPPVVEAPPPVVEEIPDQEEFITEIDDSWNTPVVEEPAAPAIGSISDISARTGKAYIVVGSFIDVDLAHDYGNKLAGEGVSTVVIAPYGNVKYYRLTVDNYPTVGDALANLDHHKAKYGDNIWVLKY